MTRATLKWMALFATSLLAACSFIDWDSLAKGSADAGAPDSASDSGPEGSSTPDAFANADASDGQAARDAPIEAPAADAHTPGDARCDPSSPFSAPVLASGPINTGYNEISGRLTDDELTLYFARDQGDGLSYDIYVANRETANDPFGTATPVNELNGPQADFDPFPLRDGVTIYFASTRPDTARSHIYVSKRPDAGAPFGAPQEVSAFNFARAPFFLAGDQTLYFQDDYDNRIYRTTSQSGSFTVPTQVLGSDVGFPNVTADDHLMLYASVGGTGADKIFAAFRADAGAPFGNGQAVDELNGAFRPDARIEATWIST